MHEELIAKAILSGGIGAGGGGLAAYFYLKWKWSELEHQIDALKKKHNDEMQALKEERDRDNKEIEEINKKLDKVLEYMTIFRTLERKIRISVEED